MTLDALADHAALVWLGTALALGLAELVIPGIFAIFLAIAAAATGITLLAVDLPWGLQFVSFAAWSGVAVAIGRRWYVDYPVASSDPLLNDRAKRLIGQGATVTDAIVAGRGRVRIGDGEWPATGPDLAVGQSVRVLAIKDGVAEVE